MNRRKFIFLSASLSLPFIHCSSRNPQWEQTISQPRTLASLADTQTLAGIGEAYTKQVPDEAQSSTLFEALTRDAGGNRISSAAAASVLSSRLEEAIKQDFDKGNIIVIKGWVLSRTEARQCAYFYLHSKSN